VLRRALDFEVKVRRKSEEDVEEAGGGGGQEDWVEEG